MARAPVYGTLFAVLIVVACNRAPTSDTTADGALQGVESQVILGDAAAGVTTRGDPFQVVGEPRIDGDTLFITVQFGGGCARHEFRLLGGRIFLESEPVQAPLVLHHDANGDNCRALLTRDLRFDLTPLKEAWQRSYGARAGRMRVTLPALRLDLLYAFR